MRAIDNLLIGLGLGLLFWLLFEPAYQYVFVGDESVPEESEALYVRDPATGEMLKSPCAVVDGEVKCPEPDESERVWIEDMDHSPRHKWHFNLPCPPISDGPITFFAGDTVVYRLSAERYEWACEEIGPGPTYFRSGEP